MGGLWTVARETFTQCVRTKAAAVFAALLVGSLALLPSLMEGDGTLAGRIRTFLDYSLSATSVLLSLVVILLSVGVVSGDVRGRHVFIVCTKPLARWHYVLGRWLGVVMLGAVLLAGAAAAIYVSAQYLRSRSDLVLRPQDRLAVETEVFSARAQVFAEPPDVDAEVARRVRQKKADGTWGAIVEGYRTNYRLNEIQATEKLVADLRSEALSEAQSASPPRWAVKPAAAKGSDAEGRLVGLRSRLSWRFAGVHAVGETRSGKGRVGSVFWREGLVVAVEVAPELAGRVILFGPVWANGIEGRVLRVRRDGFQAVFGMDEDDSKQVVGFRPGREVQVTVEPTVQVSYKVSPADRGLDEPLRAAWKLENPTTGYVYRILPQETPSDRRATLIAPARAVDKEGRVRVSFYNHSPTSVTVLHDDVSVLYSVGGFEANFVKTIALMLMGLMFLAALGVFAGCGLSFPVGCLVCFVMLWIATTLRFLTESIQLGLDYPGKNTPVLLFHVGSFLLGVMKVLLPDLVSTLGTNFLVEGVVVPWRYFGEAAAVTVAVRGLALLGLGCLIFHRRELARVQV